MIKQLKVLLPAFFVSLILGLSMNAYAEDDNQASKAEIIFSESENSNVRPSIQDGSDGTVVEEPSESVTSITIGDDTVVEEPLENAVSITIGDDTVTEEPLENATSISIEENDLISRDGETSAETVEETIIDETKRVHSTGVQLREEKISVQKPYWYKPGWNYVNGNWFYGNQDGTAKTGWLKDGAYWYYLKTVQDDPDSPGSMVGNCAYTVKNMIYSFLPWGAMKIGWQNEDDEWFYYKSNGVRVIGEWLRDKGAWYYLAPKTESVKTSGVMVRDCQRKMGASIYSFFSWGAMKTGWQKEKDNWFYYRSSGARAIGEWLRDKGAWYYLAPKTESIKTSGVMTRNCQKYIGSSIFSFSSSGAMKTGWQKEKNNWYYYDSNGVRTLGSWLLYKGYWYYLAPEADSVSTSGVMEHGKERNIGNNTYRFRTDGAMYQGWFHAKEGWYYYKPSGAKVLSGFEKIGNKYYYFLNKTEDADYPSRMFNGDMLIINGEKHFFEPNGNTYNKWYYNKAWYYYDIYGAMFTGWLDAGAGNWYYLYPKNQGPEGTMATNTTIDGYYVARNGIYNRTYQKAYNVLNRIGWTIRAAFNYASTLPYQTFSTNGSLGSKYFAEYGFSNGRGNCYVQAATFYILATLLGEEVHQISGAVPLRRGGMGPHSWVETVWKGTLYVCDPNFQYYGNNGYYIQYGQKGTWRYSSYYRMN